MFNLCDVSGGCDKHPIVRSIDSGEERCLGHALLTRCCHCENTVAYCHIEGCGTWKPRGTLAGALLTMLFHTLPRTE